MLYLVHNHYFLGNDETLTWLTSLKYLMQVKSLCPALIYIIDDVIVLPSLAAIAMSYGIM